MTKHLLAMLALAALSVGLLGCDTNPPAPTPRPTPDHPSVVWFGDSFSLDAKPAIAFTLALAGYNTVQMNAVLGASMCYDHDHINTAIQTLKPKIVVLQYQGNGSLWNCADGYDQTYKIYDDGLDSIAMNATFNGAPGGTRVFLVSPIPDTFGNTILPNAPAVTDVFNKWAKNHPDVFTVVDASQGLHPGPGALQDCYPNEDGCRPDGKIQVREDYTNPYTGVTIPGGGGHFCTKPQIANLANEVCLVPDAGARRFAYDIVNALRAAGA